MVNTMQNIILNIDELEKINLNESMIYEILKIPNFINKIRYIDSSGKPWGEWDKVCDFLEKKASEFGLLDLNNPTLKKEIENPINYLYVFSNFFSLTQNIEITFQLFCKLNNSQATIVLSRGGIADSLITFLRKNAKELTKLKPSLFILLLLKLNSIRSINSEEECIIIQHYIEQYPQINTVNSILLKALKQRLSSLKGNMQLQIYTAKGKQRKIAIFITGQSRFSDKNLSNLRNTLSTIKSDYDLFVSTWSDVGGKHAESSKLSRHIPASLVQDLVASKVNLHDVAVSINEYYKKHEIIKITLSTFENLNDYSNAFINIKDDNEFPYNEMSNPEKMYYHNCFWIRTIKQENFWQSYTHILKIRPDIECDFSALSELDISENQILTEEANGWIFREWGFGIGDQIIYGKPETSLKLLDGYNHQLAKEMCEVLFSKPQYHGHMNLGIIAWLEGITILRNDIFKHKLAATKKISTEQIMAMLSKPIGNI